MIKLTYSNIYYNFSFSGFFAYVVSFIALFAALYFEVPVTVVYDKFIPLMTSAILFSFVMSVLLYIKARLGPDSQKAPLGNTGDKWLFIIGHLKIFCYHLIICCNHPEICCNCPGNLLFITLAWILTNWPYCGEMPSKDAENIAKKCRQTMKVYLQKMQRT